MILSPQSQLLERNIALFDEGQWAFINPSDAYFLDGLKSHEVTVIHQYFDIFAECVRVIPSASFDSRDITSKGFVRNNYKKNLVDLSDVKINLKGKK